MKIGIVLYPTYGGSGIVATELGKTLAKKGHEIHFITYSQPVRLEKLRENIYFHEVRVSNYPLFDYALYEQVLISKLVDVVKYEKLDLLHVHYAIPHASAAFMAQEILKTYNIFIPTITTLHGTDITLVGKDPSFEPVITFSINKSNFVTSVSESLKQETLNHFNVKNNIEVIPNFINIKNYQLSNNEKYKKRFASNNEHIITHISNFRKVKRIDDVINIFEKVNEKLPCKLLLVGDGPERNKAELLCREKELSNNVIFLGHLKSTVEVLNISDLFLLPSEKESFGLAALEAMAAGVPVISTISGGIPELVEHGKSGFLSNIGDIKHMVQNSIKILENKNTHLNFKMSALKRAKYFDIENILPQYERLYEKALLSN